jgi:hypothetical protein
MKVDVYKISFTQAEQHFVNNVESVQKCEELFGFKRISTIENGKIIIMEKTPKVIITYRDGRGNVFEAEVTDIVEEYLGVKRISQRKILLFVDTLEKGTIYFDEDDGNITIVER